MQPWEIVDRAQAPDGVELQLARRGDEWVVRAAGRVLMSSRQHGSEEALAALAFGRLERSGRPVRAVLVGGLGLGFTLRAVLDRLPADARAIVVELVPALAAWNEGPLAPLAGSPLADPRVRLQRGDVLARISEAERAWDAILLDVDNGPSALAHGANARLYAPAGLRACRRALKPGGVLAVWSAGPDERFLERLSAAGFDPEVKPVPARSGTSKGIRHVVFLGTSASSARPLRAKGGTGQVPTGASGGPGGRRRRPPSEK